MNFYVGRIFIYIDVQGGFVIFFVLDLQICKNIEANPRSAWFAANEGQDFSWESTKILTTLNPEFQQIEQTMVKQ